MSWSEYVRQLVRGDSQVAIEKRAGVRQSTVSRWLLGETHPRPAEAASLALAYGGNVLEAFVAAGFLTEEQAGLPPRRPVAFAEIIDADPDLSPEAKVHIKNQYGLLKAASAQNRAVLLREQIERNQNLDDETRAQLLATLDGGDPSQVEQASTEMAEHEARIYPHIVQEAARSDTGEPDAAAPEDPNADPEGPEHGA